MLELLTLPQALVIAHDWDGWDDPANTAPAPLDFDTTRLAWHTARRAYIAADDAAWEYLTTHGDDATYRALCADREQAARTEMAAFATYMAATREAA